VAQVDPARKGINSAECNNSTPTFIKIQKRACKVNLFITWLITLPVAQQHRMVRRYMSNELEGRSRYQIWSDKTHDHPSVNTGGI
jgi:hypothetical protein